MYPTHAVFKVKVVVSNVYMCVCVGLLACLTPCLHSRYTFVVNNSECACKHACVYVSIMQNSPASHPNLKKKKVTQPGGHFEIPGAHLANPGNWGVYISATEKGKRPDAPFSCSAASIQRSLTSPWVTDLCVCGGVWVVGGVEVYREHWAKSLNTL